VTELCVCPIFSVYNCVFLCVCVCNIRYDTIRYSIFMCAQKLTNSQLNLPHGTKQKRVMKKLKTKKQDAQKKWSSHKVLGVGPEAGRESMVGKICERGRS